MGKLESLISSLRQYVGNRRAAPRYVTHLEKSLTVYVYLLNPRAGEESNERQTRIVGHTRDVSETGLGIVVPSVRIGGLSIVQSERTLRILLGLPPEPVEMQAVAVRAMLLDEEKPDGDYLVGVHIKQMNKSDRERYLRLLHRLGEGDF